MKSYFFSIITAVTCALSTDAWAASYQITHIPFQIPIEIPIEIPGVDPQINVKIQTLKDEIKTIGDMLADKENPLEGVVTS